MKKLILTVATGLMLGSCANAVDFYVTGATAFRNNFYNSLSNAGLVMVCGPAGANQTTWSGTWGGCAGISGATRVFCSFSGSVEGMTDLCAGTLIANFKDATTCGNFSHAADMAFSDVCITSTSLGFGACHPIDVTVGIQPFVFAMNTQAANLGVFNMSHNNFQIFAPSGTILPQYLTGSATDCTPSNNTTTVYLTGRNAFSGTRVATFSETGYGVFTSCQQWHNGTRATDVNGRSIRIGPDVATAVAHIANDGWESGSFVRADLQNATNTDAFIGYISSADGRSIKSSAAASAAIFCNWDGDPFTKCNVINGRYTFWTHEHLMTLSHTLDNAVDAFRCQLDVIASGTYCNDAWPGIIPEGAMMVFRECEGGKVQ